MNYIKEMLVAFKKIIPYAIYWILFSALFDTVLGRDIDISFIIGGIGGIHFLSWVNIKKQNYEH